MRCARWSVSVFDCAGLCVTMPHVSRSTTILVIFAIAIPAVTWLIRPMIALSGAEHALGKSDEIAGTRFPQSTLELNKQTIGPDPIRRPRISNVQVIDFDEDGIKDVIACDAQNHRVLWYRQHPVGTWEEIELGTDLLAPAHATVADVDSDGDRDVVVSILGNIYPDDRVIGKVVLLENVGNSGGTGPFKQHVIFDDVRRVADVQVGDLDGDKDMDMVVAVFGYRRGNIYWLENHGDHKFEEHELLCAAGTIHVPLADYDSDGDLDIAAVVSQDQEEVIGFENDGSGQFKKHLLYSTFNYDLGTAGLVKTDLDRDGDIDLLLPTGDNFEDLYSAPLPYHGCFWLENQGDWKFATKRIATFNGTYAAAAGDPDADGDTDVVLVSMFNSFEGRENPSIVWLENDGQQNFKTWQIANNPIHLITVDCGDINGDGKDDIVAGGFHVPYPIERFGRITAWLSTPGGTAE